MTDPNPEVASIRHALERRNGDRDRPSGTRLRAISPAPDEVAPFASLSDDLGRRSSAPEAIAPAICRVHDRTHLEIAVDYPIDAAPSVHTWEAFFFLPEGLGVDETTCDAKAIADDLRSQVRYAVSVGPLAALARLDPDGPIARISAAISACAGKADGSREAAEVTRALRLFACRVRASAIAMAREIERDLAREWVTPARVRDATAAFAGAARDVAGAMREAIAAASSRILPDEVRIAARWIDEDVSLVIETLAASLSLTLGNRTNVAPGLRIAARQLSALAVDEARYRKSRGLASVGSAKAGPRDVEQLEARRDVVQRFTSSTLCLALEPRRPAAWIGRAVFAIAAASALAFAIAARTWMIDLLALAPLAALAFTTLRRIARRWLPGPALDRRFSIRDRDRGLAAGEARERAGIIPLARVPEGAILKRGLSAARSIEERTGLDRVLWHRKTTSISPAARGDDAFPMITEIFRLDLERWLVRADEPRRKIVFADPSTAGVYAASAAHVYTINVVYKLQRDGAPAPWQRIQIVASRRGIERINEIC